MSDTSRHFQDFIASLSKVLDRYPANDSALQRGQVEGLLAAERAFRTALIAHPRGEAVYDAFVKYIVETKRNTLMARPFFRERDVTFRAHISRALRRGDVKKLYRFDVNYQFINFALKQGRFGRRAKALARLASDVRRRRRELAECNLPLAISRVRFFYAMNKLSYMSHMDMVQVAVGGLMVGIDKFAGEYSSTFRAVLIGRILGDLIEANSETFVHFFPGDRRRLYRIRKIAASLREGLDETNLEQLTKLLNRKERSRCESVTRQDQLHHLVGASSIVLASTLPTNEDGDGGGEGAAGPIERYADDADKRPDAQVEDADFRAAVSLAIKELPIIDQKLLRLRGLDLKMGLTPKGAVK